MIGTTSAIGSSARASQEPDLTQPAQTIVSKVIEISRTALSYVSIMAASFVACDQLTNMSSPDCFLISCIVVPGVVAAFKDKNTERRYVILPLASTMITNSVIYSLFTGMSFLKSCAVSCISITALIGTVNAVVALDEKCSDEPVSKLIPKRRFFGR